MVSAFGISIHAPRVGSDFGVAYAAEEKEDFNPRSPCGERHKMVTLEGLQNHFNPRSPCGERRIAAGADGWRDEFQSTLPVWGAT